MDMNVINWLLELMEKAIEWLQELYEAARQGGFPPFSLLPQKTAVDLTTAHNDLPAWDDEAIKREYRKMLTRNRVRRCRERKKMKAKGTGEPQAITGNVNPVNGNGVTFSEKTMQARMEPAFASAAVTENGNALVTACNDSVTPGNVFAKKEKETEKRKKQRKEINKNKKNIKTNIADAMPNSARARDEEAERAEGKTASLFAGTDDAETEGSGLPFQSPEKKTQTLIPTAELPEVCRNIVGAWNKLPLPKKLRGLYPSLVKRLNYLLENYGEEQIHKAISSIADSPFLLGKSKNNRGWVVSINWFMDPEHLEKILSGDYHDDRSSGRHCLFQPGDELQPWGDGFYGTVVY